MIDSSAVIPKLIKCSHQIKASYDDNDNVQEISD